MLQEYFNSCDIHSNGSREKVRLPSIEDSTDSDPYLKINKESLGPTPQSLVSTQANTGSSQKHHYQHRHLRASKSNSASKMETYFH